MKNGMEILERYENGVIALIETDKLHDHEQINPNYLQKLIEQIKKDNELRYPIIVDKYSYVVLDGHHRYFALKALGCKKIPAFVVDYYSPEIKVDRWCPVMRTKREVDTVFKALESDGFAIREVESEKVLRVVVQAGQAVIGFVIDGDKIRYYIVQSSGRGYYEAISCIRNAILKLNGKELEYIAGSHKAVKMLQDGELAMAIIIPKLSKEKIIETASKGHVLPPKTTRHVLPEKKYYPVPLIMLK